MYYKTEIISIINAIRDIDVDSVGSRLLRIVGTDALPMIGLLKEYRTDDSLAQLDLIFGLPHRNLSDRYNAQYTVSKAALGTLTSEKMLELQQLTITALINIQQTLDLVESFAEN
jgi:hypothetical protein